MRHNTHYQNLINRGRKAGLNTREIYSAIASLRVAGSERALGQSDSNGFVSSLTQHGQCVYRPVEGYPRP